MSELGRFLEAMSNARNITARVAAVQVYVTHLETAGVITRMPDGQVNGKAADGTVVQLGHIIKSTPKLERQDWDRLAAYLVSCPLPSHW